MVNKTTPPKFSNYRPLNIDYMDNVDSIDDIEIPEYDEAMDRDIVAESMKRSTSSKKSDYSDGGTFLCDYCEKRHHKSELHVSAEKDSTYKLKNGFFGRGIIEKVTRTHSTLRCRRCTIIHYIAGWFHFLLGLVCIGLLCYPTWKTRSHFDFEDYIMPAVVGGFAAYLISRIDWIVIKLLFGVRRKP